jgi:hypothetical protein
MKKLLVLLFFIISKTTSIEQNNIIFTDPIAISLGFSCTTSDMLRIHNIRCAAFPFDWIRSSFDGLCNLLQDDFLDFLNPEYLTFENTFIFNRKYTLTFHHDFPAERTEGRVDYLKENYLDFIGDVSGKYQRRIERFYEVLNSGRIIYLFRLSSYTRPWNLDLSFQTKDRVIKLRDILSNKFPNCNFILVVIDSTEEYKTDWQLDRVKNFYIQNVMSKDEWGNIFKTLGLIQ